MFARNHWYVIAAGEEVGPGDLLARVVLGEPVVLFRDEAGTAVALRDQCSHRRFPLSLGQIRTPSPPGRYAFALLM